MTEFTHDVDARGLSCPLPILRAKKALATMVGGDILRLKATDPGSVVDFAAFARETGDELLESTTEGDTFIFMLKKKYPDSELLLRRTAR